MRALLATMIVLALAAAALAQICPATPGGYIRQYRPQGEPANYPPQAEPSCYMQTTNQAGNYMSCYLCHDYMHKRGLS